MGRAEGNATALLPLSGDPLKDPQPSIPLPSPHISFHLWTDEEQLCESCASHLAGGELAGKRGVCVCVRACETVFTGLCPSVTMCTVSACLYVCLHSVCVHVCAP